MARSRQSVAWGLVLAAMFVLSPPPASAVPGATEVERLTVRVDGTSPDDLSFDNMFSVHKRSAGFDGSTMVFAARNGEQSDPGYAPMAPGEQCPDGFCSDLYLRDLVAGTTRSISAAIEVGNQHEFSFWPFAYSSGTWAVAADHDTFLFNYQCYGVPSHGSEVIGGTAVCGPEDPGGADPMVVFDLSSEQIEVLPVERARAIDVADDGDTALFSDLGTVPADCFAPGWDCEEGTRLAIWRRGRGVTPVAATAADDNDDDASRQVHVGAQVLSGDGEAVLFSTGGFEIANDTGAFHEAVLSGLYRYDVATGATTELPLPDHPPGRWTVLDTDGDGSVVALSYQPVDDDDDAYTAPDPRLLVVEVDTGSWREVPGASCAQGIGSMSGDGRWVSCWRVGQFDAAGALRLPAVVDTQTGLVGDVLPDGQGFVGRYYFGPMLARDGGAVAVEAVTGSLEDGEAHVYGVTVGEVDGHVHPGPGGAPVASALLGGEAVVTPAVEQALTSLLGAPPQRLAGQDRYETATEVAKGSWSGAPGTVYVATGSAFPDALAGGAAAATVDAPMLLMAHDGIDDSTRSLLSFLWPDVEEVVVVGGEAAVSDAGLDALEDATGVRPRRIAGTNRYDTAAAVVADAFPDPVDVVVVATGENYPDALAGSAAAGRLGAPVLLVTHDGVPATIEAQLRRLAPERVLVLGGEAAVSRATVAALGSITGVTPERISGDDRYATSVAIVREVFPSLTHAIFATGQNFPDALAGSAAAARREAPVLLVARDAVPEVVADHLGG